MKVALAPFGPSAHNPAFSPAGRLPSFRFGLLPDFSKTVWAFFVLLLMVHTSFDFVHLVKLLGLTVSLVGLHLAGPAAGAGPGRRNSG